MVFTDYVLLLFGTTPRRAKGMFNVLRGRRTVSTLFAGLTAGCLDLLDSWHGVPLEDFMAATAVLEENGLLISPEAGSWQLTAAGQARWVAIQEHRYLPQAFSRFQTVDVRRFQQVSQLALQVTSELVHHERRYYPTTTDPSIQALVKRWLRQQSTTDLGDRVHAALTAFLTSVPTDELATVFVDSLTGYQAPGRTNDQLAMMLHRQPLETGLMRTDVSCQWVRWLQVHPDDPLWPLLAPLVQSSPVSKSAQQTYQAFTQTHALTKIATARKLKLSTVREHLLEVAIWLPSFPFTTVLDAQVIETLTRCFAGQPEIASWSFQDAQAALPELDFFEFRLFQIMRCHHVGS
ncbi:helix-turn-helix domain-containing protein [Lactiplantibacillus pentosus]|jgi:uncharacterized protein YpbB|uniref:helix-turn-helix domain-containing protein n=1 Tax=Lactiplantibacillus pentosus TaxID=1589 RepID=UPI0021A93783|nr:helix-turn-helix domain-containing protein [Lactiplantibacillus pentosus]